MAFHLRSIPLWAMETMIWLCKETVDTLICSKIYFFCFSGQISGGFLLVHR